jgi:hypothetical protein
MCFAKNRKAKSVVLNEVLVSMRFSARAYPVSERFK